MRSMPGIESGASQIGQDPQESCKQEKHTRMDFKTVNILKASCSIEFSLSLFFFFFFFKSREINSRLVHIRIVDKVNCFFFKKKDQALIICLTRQASKAFSESVKQMSGSEVPHGNVPNDKNVGSSWQGGSSTHGKGYAVIKQDEGEESVKISQRTSRSQALGKLAFSSPPLS